MPTISQAPEFLNGSQFSGQHFAETIGVEKDAFGATYMVGYFSGTINFRPESPEELIRDAKGISDLFVAKFNPLGDLEWVKTFGGKGIMHPTDCKLWQGRILISGIFTDTVQIETHNQPLISVSNGKEDIFFLSLDFRGESPNITTLGGWYNDAATCIDIDSYGNLYVAGYFSGTVNFNLLGGNTSRISNGLKDFFLIKYSPDNNILYLTTAGGSTNESIEAITLLSDGSTIAGGTYNQPLQIPTLDGQTLLSHKGSTDAFVMAVNSTGGIVWGKGFGGKNAETVTEVLYSDFEKIYLAGTFSDTVNFASDESPALRYSKGYGDAFLLCMSADGVYQNVATVGGSLNETVAGCKETNNNEMILFGAFRGSMPTPNSASFDSLYSHGMMDPFLSRIDSSTQVLWTGHSGGPTDDIFNDFHIDNQNLLTAVGYSGPKFNAAFYGTDNLLVDSNSVNLFLVNYNGCILPNRPTIQAPGYGICFKENATLYLTNDTLNSALGWVWRKDSCNGPVVGVGDSLTIKQYTTTQYFVSGSGGCIANADCASVIVLSTGCFAVAGQAGNVPCFGGTTSLQAKIQNGIAPYSFSLDNAIFQADSLFVVPAGTYTMYAKDGAGRIAISSPVTARQPDALQIAGVCYNPVDQYLGVLAAGGTPPYQFSMNGTTFFDGRQRGKTAYVFSNILPNTYQLYVKDKNGCTTTQSVSTSSLSQCPASKPANLIKSSFSDDLNEKIIQTLMIKPNPSSDYFEITLPISAHDRKIEVWDITGKKVYVNNHAENHLSIGENWQPGLYLVRVSSGIFSETVKLIKF
jgi:hypothetical protein